MQEGTMVSALKESLCGWHIVDQIQIDRSLLSVLGTRAC